MTIIYLFYCDIGKWKDYKYGTFGASYLEPLDLGGKKPISCYDTFPPKLLNAPQSASNCQKSATFFIFL
jgi:hypothetical protein